MNALKNPLIGALEEISPQVAQDFELINQFYGKFKGLEKKGWVIKEKIGGSMKPPHITLCRVRSVSNKDEVVSEIKKIKTRADEDLKFVVNSNVFLNHLFCVFDIV